MHDYAPGRRGLLAELITPKVVMESALSYSLFIFCCFSCAIVIPIAGSNDIDDHGGARTLLKNEDDHAAETQPYSGPKELYFCQTLDHFNFLDNRTWDQRYFLIGIVKTCIDDWLFVAKYSPTSNFHLGCTLQPYVQLHQARCV